MSFFLFYRDEGIMTTFIDPATGYEVLVIRKPIRRICRGDGAAEGFGAGDP